MTRPADLALTLSRARAAPAPAEPPERGHAERPPCRGAGPASLQHYAIACRSSAVVLRREGLLKAARELLDEATLVEATGGASGADGSAAPVNITEQQPRRPRRVQLSRRRGARLPPDAISVAAPTKWANPYRPAARTAAANAATVEHFRAYLARNPGLVAQARVELAGRDLACSCPAYLPCHADIWLELANPSRQHDDAAGPRAPRG